MRILSWDIGIKHLAFCIIDKLESDFEVIDWGMIDISENDCNCFYCKSKAKYILGETFLCMKHKKKMELPTIDEIYPKHKKKDKCCVCDRLCVRGNMCGIHAKKEYNEKYKIQKIQSCMKQSLQSLCISLFNKLNEKIKLPVDYVLIENQPTLTNPTMKSISMMVFSYFIYGIMNKKVKEIKFISPSDKLKCNKEKTKEALSRCKTKSEKYHVTKQLAKDFCFQLIANKENAIQLINSYQKQDDMCDAFLQGYNFISKI